MAVKDQLVRVFSGTEVSVILLKGLLEDIGVISTMRNDYRLGIEVGFVGGVQSSVDLFVQESDFQKAEPVIREFIVKNSEPAD